LSPNLLAKSVDVSVIPSNLKEETFASQAKTKKTRGWQAAKRQEKMKRGA
jgi:hypothetical protein